MARLELVEEKNALKAWRERQVAVYEGRIRIVLIGMAWRKMRLIDELAGKTANGCCDKCLHVAPSK